ncbi:MAG: carbohydrate-binding domain-containing protein [Prevotella sp.]|nr:carbohydrate-binding domain-containing protein [Bacteroides sp.]MCM1437286.1 carbohydrate-binding domain-containing protein [Prevotella sp.]
MKKLIVYPATMLALLITQGADADVFNISTGDVNYLLFPTKCGDMVFNGGNTLTILGHEFNLNDITSMKIEEGEVEDNVVGIEFTDGGAKVIMDGKLADYVNVEVNGGHVSIIQADGVDDKNCGEITYRLSGATDNGSFYMEGKFKATVELAGVEIVNPSGAAVDIQNGKRIKLDVKKNTVNILQDGTDGKQKGALVCKGHLEIIGAGILRVTGNTSHGIYSKEYVTLKSSTIEITSTKKDGVNCNQYFSMESGTLRILSPGDDGVQVSFKDSENREEEDTGMFILTGGEIDIAVSSEASKGIKADGGITISGGKITASVTGNGIWDSEKSKTKASSCLGTDGDLTLNGGELTLSASGSGGKGISAEGKISITDGNVNITTTGGILVYSNGTLNHNYTGSTDRIASDCKSSPKGIKGDGDIVIDGGNINVSTSGNGGEGIESKSELTVNGGVIVIDSYDDAINSSSHMYINGGDITVVARHNDGLDSNGNLYLKGGRVRAFGASSPECGIDANEEEGYSVYFTGGELLAVGGSNSVPKNSTSTQAYVSVSASMKAGQKVTLKDVENELVSFIVPDNYSGSSSSNGGRPGGWGPGGASGGGTLITCPGIESGKSYTITVDSNTYTATATLKSSGSSRPW